ncbi:MAG: hypothetical protein HC897_10120 [Thermoanaerobaculia bacterium]|nr:hypothetical protein [Thermoanaerobaculia bacterium]
MLRERVAKLEQQNKAILATLEKLEAQRLPEPSAAVPAPTPVEAPKEVLAGKSKMSFYGFLRLDAIYDDSQTNGIQIPTLVLSEDPRLGGGGHDSSNLHPRLTRFGMNYAGPQIGSEGPRPGARSRSTSKTAVASRARCPGCATVT